MISFKHSKLITVQHESSVHGLSIMSWKSNLSKKKKYLTETMFNRKNAQNKGQLKL